jgi:hypothetical protein
LGRELQRIPLGQVNVLVISFSLGYVAGLGKDIGFQFGVGLGLLRLGGLLLLGLGLLFLL